MDKKVLIAYGTKHGATREIGERIGQRLKAKHFDVDVLPAKKVSDLSAYEAVIVGSAVYIGQWVKEAVKFVQSNEQALSGMPVWIFSSGPTGEGDAAELVQGWKIPRNIQENIDKIKPNAVVVFHGALEDSKLNWLEKWMIGKVGAAKGDFRDWDQIDRWADGVSVQLSQG